MKNYTRCRDIISELTPETEGESINILNSTIQSLHDRLVEEELIYPVKIFQNHDAPKNLIEQRNLLIRKTAFLADAI